MDIKKEKIIAYCVAAALFAVGVVCYAAFPDKQPEKPIRVMFQATAGKALFSHETHSESVFYGLKCVDCHHKWVEADSAKPAACRECHKVVKAEGDDPKQPKRSDALHERCIGCHDKTGHGPVDCSGCHVL